MNPTGANPDVPDVPDIKDVLPPDPVADYTPLLIGIAVVILLLVLVGSLLWFFLLKDRNRSRVPANPQQIALKKLREIAERAAELSPNEFSLQVSETLKDYLSARFGDPLRYETSEEFIARLSADGNARLPESKRNLVAGFVQISDEIKFGRPPDAEEKKPTLMQQARSVVEDPIEIATN